MSDEVEQRAADEQVRARTLAGFGETAWSYADQEAAMKAGFSSVAEWGLYRVVKEIIPELRERIEALEERLASEE